MNIDFFYSKSFFPRPAQTSAQHVYIHITRIDPVLCCALQQFHYLCAHYEQYRTRKAHRGAHDIPVLPWQRARKNAVPAMRQTAAIRTRQTGQMPARHTQAGMQQMPHTLLLPVHGIRNQKSDAVFRPANAIPIPRRCNTPYAAYFLFYAATLLI